MTHHTLQYGETLIEYDLSFARRKTLAITVHPDDLRVTVIAPENTTLPTIEAKVRQRAPWILRQQRELELYLPHLPPREYVSGETHRYLGRQYRLKVLQGEGEWVKLDGGYFYIRTLDKSNTDRVAEQIESWYTRQAYRVFHERLRLLLPRFERLALPEFEMKIKKLEAKWGLCTEDGIITLNLKLIQVSKPLIDYVLAHELCHLIEHNHSSRFYTLLSQIMPDWKDRRLKLNQAEVS